MLHNTFGQIVEMARSEARLSTNTSRGIDHLDHVKQLVRRHYTMLAEDFDWEHLKIKKDYDVSRKQLQAGQRAYDYPAALNVQKITKAWVKWGNVWHPLDYGIAFDDFNGLDPDASVRADPVTKWSMVDEAQFEVWPTPASNGDSGAPYSGWIGFDGQKAVTSYVNDGDRADLDDHLVALHVAAELLAENGQKAASDAKVAAAQRRMRQLRGSLSHKGRFVMGRGFLNERTSTFPRHPIALYKGA